jgi:hypothetical protein
MWIEPPRAPSHRSRSAAVRVAPAAAGAKILSFPGLLRLVLRTQPRSAFDRGGAVTPLCRSAPSPADRGSVTSVTRSALDHANVFPLNRLSASSRWPSFCWPAAPAHRSRHRRANRSNSAWRKSYKRRKTKDVPRARLLSLVWPALHQICRQWPATGRRRPREGEHKGLSAPPGLKLRSEDLQIDVFNNADVATFTLVATIQSGADAITSRERDTLVFVKHEGS